jgi:hypothetical protein
MTVNFSGNGNLRLNGGFTVGSFTNVAAAAQNGRDLTITMTNISFQFGTGTAATQFYADAGRTLTYDSNQISNTGGDLNKEGAGTLILNPSSANVDMATRNINIHGGVLAAKGTFNNDTQINVSTGASLQAGIVSADTLNIGAAAATFANNSALRVVTNGTTVSELQNGTVTKGATDTFNIVLTGLNPAGTQTLTPNALIIQANTLTGFDPNGTYTQSSPGHFALSGDGFLVTGWSVDVLNNNQVRLNSVTVTPVPAPAPVLLIVAAGVSLMWLGQRGTRLVTSGR